MSMLDAQFTALCFELSREEKMEAIDLLKKAQAAKDREQAEATSGDDGGAEGTGEGQNAGGDSAALLSSLSQDLMSFSRQLESMGMKALQQAQDLLEEMVRTG